MKRNQVTGVVAASVLALGVFVSAQGQGPGQGRGRGTGMAPTTGIPTGKEVHITGQNPGLQLRMVANGPIVNEVNYWRVDWSPMGTGHVCYLMTGDGKGPNDLRLVLTDNEKLANFVTYDTMSKLVPNFATPPYKLVKATFRYTGDSINEHTEYCESDQYKVAATWRKITPGRFGGMTPPNGFIMSFIISMAAEGEITLNGKKLAGTVLPGPGRPPSYLAFAETWLKQ